MASVDELLGGLFAFLGLPGIVLGLFVVFVVDAALFPLLPELAIVLAFSFLPSGLDPFAWAVALLAAAVAGEAVGNATLYVIVHRALINRGRMPAMIERAMRRWIDFLVVRDERIILVNRVAPVVPLVGAFIATCGWDVRKSLAYVVGGAAGKYALLLALSGFLGVAYDPIVARWVTVAFVVGIVAVSLVASVVVRRRVRAPPRRGD
ncbi:MAG: hypothetical protein ACT4OI_06035 [Methanobacteriota archaeon]